MRCKEENNKNTHITCRHNKKPAELSHPHGLYFIISKVLKAKEEVLSLIQKNSIQAGIVFAARRVIHQRILTRIKVFGYIETFFL